jgi:hypothetical protein
MIDEEETVGCDAILDWLAYDTTYYFGITAVTMDVGGAIYDLRVLRFAIKPSWDSCE